jgi:hypothetical protein
MSLSPFQRRMLIDNAPGWRPTAGDTFTGEFVGWKTGSGNFGAYPVFIFQTGQADFVAWHAFHQLAQQVAKDLNFEQGKVYTIAYIGRVARTKVNAKGIEEDDSYENYYGEPGDGTAEVTNTLSGADLDWQSFEKPGR